MASNIIFITSILILFTGIINIVINRFLYKKSIVFHIIAMLTFPILIAVFLGFFVGYVGLNHFIWCAPLVILFFLAGNELIARMFRNPLKDLFNKIDSLSKGDLNLSFDEKSLKGEHELANLMRSTSTLNESLKNIATFAGHVGKGELNVEYTLASENDSLGQAMLDMRGNLQTAEKEKEERRKEDERRNWATEGIARFADLLRTNNDNIEELCHLIVSNLVKYIGANQAGIFILNDDDAEKPVLELKACYAYERRKYLEKTINIGEGVVGTCYLERESIYMTQIPKDYIHITSGLGNDTARALLITPLKVNEGIYGVLEIAAFKEFEPHVREFVEKVAESIASTIGSVKVNIRTNKLLEVSKMQGEEMANQEEELRQNMEEMQATQEEMFKKQEESERAHDELVITMSKMEEMQEVLKNEKLEIQSVMSAVDHVLLRITYGADMTTLEVNNFTLDFFGFTLDQMLGVKLTDRMRQKDIPDFKERWAKVLNGGSFEEVGIRNTKAGERQVWYSYSPIKDVHGNVHKVLMLGRLIEQL